MPLATIKLEIKANLDALVPTTLGEVQVDDNRGGTDIFDRDFGKFPVAVLTTPAITSDYFTNRENGRTYEFTIFVLQKLENVTSAMDIENLIEAVLGAFDNDPTLNGVAHGGVEPSSSPVASFPSRGKTYIAFTITLKARESIPLTF